MNRRTPAQYAADRRRSHKAQAKRNQKGAAWAFRMAKNVPGSPDTGISLMQASATYARMARRSLNFVLTGEYEDFA
jgi:hypothetical protein